MQIEDAPERDKVIKATCEGCGKYRVLFNDGVNKHNICRECMKQGKHTKHTYSCLKCDKKFETYTKHNRVCSYCKTSLDWVNSDNGYKTWRR